MSGLKVPTSIRLFRKFLEKVESLQQMIFSMGNGVYMPSECPALWYWPVLPARQILFPSRINLKTSAWQSGRNFCWQERKESCQKERMKRIAGWHGLNGPITTALASSAVL